MHRAIGRALRGTCRQFRENDCPIAAGEDVRKKKDDDSKKDFVPRKHSWEEAVTWTTGLVIGYQLTHGRRRGVVDECPSIKVGVIDAPKTPSKSEKSCPFALTSRVLNQPVFSPGSSTALRVKRSSTGSVPSAAVVPSIDITPFIHDDVQDDQLPEMRSTPTIVEDEDIVFELESVSKGEARKNDKDNCPFRKPSVLERINNNPAEYGTRYAADLLSVLGAYEFLQMESQPNYSPSSAHLSGGSGKAKPSTSKSNKSSSRSPTSKEKPPIHAIELMRKGAELGSCRALYNMGVAYERLNDISLAREYYKKAADLGHPLATYNCAVFALRDGHLTEGYALMKMASNFGVPEAEEFMKPPINQNEQISVQYAVGRV